MADWQFSPSSQDYVFAADHHGRKTISQCATDAIFEHRSFFFSKPGHVLPSFCFAWPTALKPPHEPLNLLWIFLTPR